MNLINKIKKEEIKGLTKNQVLQAFRQSCWDLYLANLPDPVIINTEEVKKDKLPDNIKGAIPRGFFIDPETWTTYFNNEDVPKNLKHDSKLEKYLSEEEKKGNNKEDKQYARSIFQHENTHFTKVPADRVTEAILVDSALKGFKDQTILQNKELASAYAYLVMNIMGDLIGDTFLAKEKYGREDFEDLTVWRQKETISDARQTQQSPSLLWQTLVSTYEKLWKEDLGLNSYIQKANPLVEKTSNDLVSILGRDWKYRKTWEDKIKKFASALEPIIKQSAEEAKNQRGKSRYGKGSGKGSSLPIPDDVKTQLGNPTESPLGEQHNGEKVSREKNNGGSAQVDEGVLEEIYQRNKNAPGKFAGTMGALHKLEPDDALRLMYRARAKELLMKIKEKENQRAEKSPSYQTSWNIGDPIIGKGGLELIPSMMTSPKPIPGLTTYKRKMQRSETRGRLKMIPDLFIEIDSSGSMSWDPWNNNPNSRGDFDKAILAAEGASLYAIENGGRVAIINFSGEGNVTQQDYSDNIDDIEKAVMVNYHGGTVIPVKETKNMIKKTNNPLLTCIMSDCEISNSQEACDEAFSHSINEHDSMTVFNINQGTGQDFTKRIKEKGAVVYDINKIEDLAGIIIGKVKADYDSGLKEK